MFDLRLFISSFLMEMIDRASSRSSISILLSILPLLMQLICQLIYQLKTCQFQQLALTLQLTCMSGITYLSFDRDFRFEKRLGKGNYATVNQVLHLIDQRSYAHKCIELSNLEQLSQAFNEIETIKCIDDERIIKLAYYYTRQNKKTGKYELGMIMELCHTNLGEVIKKRKMKNDYFTKSELKDFIGAMLPFFAKMQRKGYLHRDIKPDNILLVKNSYNKFQYKIGDFGFAIKLNAYSTQNIAGTLEYVSPKLVVKFRDNKIIVPGHNYKDDVYSFGKTLYEYMTLQTNPVMSDTKGLECSNRYGAEYWGLNSLMIKTEEAERPDFIYLESYAVRKQLIPQTNSQLSKNNFLSISTVNGVQSKKSQTLEKFDKKNKKQNTPSKEKNVDITKTRKKQTDNNSDLTRIQSLQSSRGNLKTSRMKDENKKKKIFAYGEQIHSLLAFQNFLFIGSQGKLGVMILANEKILKIQCDIGESPITCIKMDQQKKFLLFGTMNNKLVIIEINEIKRFVIENHRLFQKKSEVEMQLKLLKHKKIDGFLPISAFDCCNIDEKNQPTFILGHYTGEMTVIKGESKVTQISFSKVPITHIIYQQGYVYTTTGEGIFKKEPSMTLGLWAKQGEKSKIYQPYTLERNTTYKYCELLVTFQLIRNCKYNETIEKAENKYEAILISYDGLAHIISRSFKLEKLVRLTENSIITAIFCTSTSSELGVEGLIVDIEGKVHTHSGMLLQKTDEKRIGCISSHSSGIYLGTYSKNLIIIPRKDTLVID